MFELAPRFPTPVPAPDHGACAASLRPSNPAMPLSSAAERSSRPDESRPAARQVAVTAYDATGALTRMPRESVDDAAAAPPVPAVPTETYRYEGHAVESATGRLYNRARHDDPRTGRWLSADPVGFEAGNANRYRYVASGLPSAPDASRPASGSDRDGLST